MDTSKASINDNAVWPEVYYNAYGGTRPKVTDFVTAYENKEIDWYDGKLDFKDQKVTGTTDEDDHHSPADDRAEDIPYRHLHQLRRKRDQHAGG